MRNAAQNESRDGVERPIDDSGTPIRDPQGRLLGVVLVFRDVTEHRCTEEARARLGEHSLYFLFVRPVASIPSLQRWGVLLKNAP